MPENQGDNISPIRLVKTQLNMLRKKDDYSDAEAYDYIVDRFLGRRKLARGLALCLEKVLPPGENTKVLDEACGTGALIS